MGFLEMAEPNYDSIQDFLKRGKPGEVFDASVNTLVGPEETARPKATEAPQTKFPRVNNINTAAAALVEEALAQEQPNEQPMKSPNRLPTLKALIPSARRT